MGMLSAKDLNLSSDDSDIKACVDALIRIACNTGNSMTLRDVACEQLAHKVAHNPDLAVYAARELFAKRDAGFPPETVFDALIKVIREARFSTSAIFRDAVDAICENNTKLRRAATTRVVESLGMRRRTSAAA